MNTDVVDIYPMKFTKQFVNTLEDNVRFRGAPTKLVSDRAQVKISGRALEFPRVYGISAWQSEPHQQHQNYAERKIQQLKQMTNVILDCTGAPSSVWLSNPKLLIPIRTTRPMSPTLPLTTLLPSSMVNLHPIPSFRILQHSRHF